MKRNLLLFLNFLFIVLLSYSVPYNYQTKATMNLSLPYISFTVETYIAIIVISILAGILGYSCAAIRLEKKYKEMSCLYSKKADELSIQNEINSDDKQTLQRKIETLEIALEQALKNQN